MPSKAKPKKRKRSTLSDEDKAARKAQREADLHARIQEWAKAEAAKAPPLNPETIAKIAVLLRPGLPKRQGG